MGGVAVGMVGAVISIEQLEPECLYLVEEGSTGRDYLIAADHLWLIE